MTIPKECKRLAEVDFPIAEVSKHAAREKSIRHGHPSTLHLWWARRPLASSRAVLLALLLPDPLDAQCPVEFKSKARELLEKVQKLGSSDADLRAALLKFIGDFANWDLAANPKYLEVGRGLVKAAHPDEAPLVVDPFAGGGSIPLEALRLGCDAFASDINPVAGLIQKVMLEDIPRYGRQKIKVQTEQGEVEADGLAEAVRLAGAEIKRASEKELEQFYPPDPDGARPIAYIWARTVRCESPNCGAEIPLVRSFWLCKKTNRRLALRTEIIREPGSIPRVGLTIFTPKDESEVQGRTVKRANATCLCCQTTLSAERVRVQLSSQLGGADVIFDQQGHRIGGALMIAVALLRPGEMGRQYRLANKKDYDVVQLAHNYLSELNAKKTTTGFSITPDEPLPWKHGHRSIGAPRIYGMKTWGDYFTARQKLSLSIFIQQLNKLEKLGTISYLLEPLSLIISKLSELSNANGRWEPVAECPRSIFSRHDLPATWDFAEGVTTSSSSGGFEQVLDNFVNNLSQVGCEWSIGQVQQADACESPLADESVQVWFTDPPYYDAVAYADLSDFFYVWLKRCFITKPIAGDPFDKENPLVPKSKELTVTTVSSENGLPKNKNFFESGMGKAFAEGRRVLSDQGLACVVFAHKTTEGWESLLGGMLKAGWVIVSSWPIATEMGHRFNARDVAALATSVHLVCRPRPEDAPLGDWSAVSRELPRKVGDWMQRLQSEGVRGADLVFACIGPALEIYSRYSKVVDAEDREIPLGGDPEAREPHLRGYLAYVWEVVGRMALEQVLGAGETAGRTGTANALEEDARLTALFLWTMQSTDSSAPAAKAEKQPSMVTNETDDDDEETPKAKTKSGFSLPFDVVRRFAQPLGIHLPDWEGRIIDSDKGVITLLAVNERAHQLLGEEDAQSFADALERDPERPKQMSFFTDADPAPRARAVRKASKPAVASTPHHEVTTLDRLHTALLLQKSGQSNALRALIKTEQDRSPDFLRLANALSALYPRECEEKRLLDAMLVNVGR